VPDLLPHTLHTNIKERLQDYVPSVLLSQILMCRWALYHRPFKEELYNMYAHSSLLFHSVTRQQEAQFMLGWCGMRSLRWSGHACPKGFQPWELREVEIQLMFSHTQKDIQKTVSSSNSSSCRRGLFLLCPLGGMPLSNSCKGKACARKDHETSLISCPFLWAAAQKAFFAWIFNKN
jgi:hypothetical protein